MELQDKILEILHEELNGIPMAESLVPFIGGRIVQVQKEELKPLLIHFANWLFEEMKEADSSFEEHVTRYLKFREL